MSVGKKLVEFWNNNYVLITGAGLIIGIHWTWWKLQNVPSLVRPEEKKDLPIIRVAKSLKVKLEEAFRDKEDPKST